MKMKTFHLLTILILATYSRSYAQTNSVVPVTPEAAALSKMVNYPVNLNTGVPDINIPFYEINVGGMKLPINLTYHAGGFKINEQATRAGLGWSLSSDLQITRTVNGKDDFDSSYGYLANPFMKRYNSPSSVYPFGSTSPFPYANIYDLASGGRDGSPDKFNYKLLNKSGSFYFLKNSSGSGFTVLPVPYDNVKIQYNNGQFIITDTDGTTYYYGEPGGGDVLSTKVEATKSGGNVNYVRTAWKCTRIVSATGTDEISFSYVAKPDVIYRNFSDRIEYYSNEEPCTLDEYYTSNEPPMSYTTDYDQLPAKYKISTPKYLEVIANNGISKYHVPYVDAQGNVVDKVYEKTDIVNSYPSTVKGLSVSEITFRGGKVVFSGIDKLNYIRVLDANNNEVKSMNFFHSYTQALYAAESKFYNGSNFQGTMYLDSVHIKNSGDTFDRYALSYNDKFCYGNHLKGHDAWGYPNHRTTEIAKANAMGDILSLPKKKIIEPRYYFSLDMGCVDYTTDIPITIGADDWAEAADESTMMRGVLKRIVYPTGGSVDFDFEANQYMASLNNLVWQENVQQLSGGLRIRAINYYEPQNMEPVTQKYYRYGNLEEGTGVLLRQPQHVESIPTGYGGEGKYNLDIVSYDQTLVYLRGNSPSGCNDRNCLQIITKEKKTTYEPASAIDYTYSNGAPIYYTRVTEYKQDLGIESGKMVYEYYDPDHFYDYVLPLRKDIRIPQTNLTYLKTDGLMGAQKSITEYRLQENLRYEPVHKRSFEYQRYLRPNRIHVAYAFLKVLYQVVEGSYSGGDRLLYDDSKLFSGGLDIPEEEYIRGEYGLPSGKLLLMEEKEIWYEGDEERILTTSYTYDHLPYLQASEIATTDSKGQTRSTTIKYPYNYLGTPIYADMVADNMIDMVIEKVETNETLDKEVSRSRTNYKEWPVGFGLIAPKDIQRSFQGEPLFTETTFDEYDEHGNILQTTEKDGLVTSYLWGYQDLYPVVQVKGATYASIPTAFKSNVQINNPASDGALRTLLDDLRDEYHGIQQVNIYTYKRLVGVTSHTAPNGQLTYYEYDGAGRLTAVKDHDQKLVDKYEYAMRGPTAQTANQVYHTNVPVMRTYNTTPSGSGVGIYNHIVPGGKHISSSKFYADLDAEDDVSELPSPLDGTAYISEHNAEITLSGEFYDILDAPSWIDIDFLQEGSVVASQRLFPYSGGTYTSTTLFLPEGHYQISMRVDPTLRYLGDIIGYAMHIGVYPNKTYYRIHTGESIFFERDQEYNIDATNFDF